MTGCDSFHFNVNKQIHKKHTHTHTQELNIEYTLPAKTPTNPKSFIYINLNPIKKKLNENVQSVYL